MIDIQIHVHYEIMKSKVPRVYVWLGHHCILNSQHNSWPEYMSDKYFLNESLLLFNQLSILSFICKNSEVWGYTFTLMKTDADYSGGVKFARFMLHLSQPRYNAQPLFYYFQMWASQYLKAKSTFGELIDLVLFTMLFYGPCRIRNYIHTDATLIVKTG